MKSNLIHWTIPLLIFSYNPNALAQPPGKGIANPLPETLTADNSSNPELFVPTNPITPSPATSSLTTSIPNQTGVIQFNNTGLSALTYPNCGGTCLFAIGRLVPTSNGSTSAEAVAGVVWQLRSPENTQAEAQRLLIKAQTENLTQESTLLLTEKLADALEQRKPERIKLLAILLAKRLGYSDYYQLLQQLDRP
jgi:hypothetical protein